MIRYLSLFSGIGAFEKALDNLGIPYELLAYCEVDKYASKAYSLLHHVPESMNLGDITKVDEKALPTDIDLLTYGFPCQDISIAGNKRGFVNEDGTKTRSGLFFDALRIIEHCKPKVAIAENVKNLTSKSMLHDLCKCDSYIHNPDGTYSYNPDILLPGHGDKSVILAQKIVDLTDEEMACIRWHMGAFDDKENWDKYGKSIEKYPNVLWTHTADMMAARIFKI